MPPAPATGLLIWALVAAACLLDRLLGDPRSWPHPVVLMGRTISGLRRLAEAWAGDHPWRLRLSGLLITLSLTAASALAGWLIEQLAWRLPVVGVPLLLLALASALAGRSLEQAVREVLDALPPTSASGADIDLTEARRRLGWIVGRDVEQLEEAQILRALAETASENGVDGLFAPLFWMLVGAALWSLSASAAPLGPGPLCLAWLFKAASTLDSMLGYRRGRLRWLGTAGARLDDGLTWLPCRLVALTLPLLPAAAGVAIAHPDGRPGPSSPWQRFRRALREGAPDPSPNAGVSQAAYALAAGVRLGGVNRYQGQERVKPLLAAECAAADRAAIERLLGLSRRLELAWLLAALPLLMALGGLGGLA